MSVWVGEYGCAFCACACASMPRGPFIYAYAQELIGMYVRGVNPSRACILGRAIVFVLMCVRARDGSTRVLLPLRDVLQRTHRALYHNNPSGGTAARTHLQCLPDGHVVGEGDDIIALVVLLLGLVPQHLLQSCPLQERQDRARVRLAFAFAPACLLLPMLIIARGSLRWALPLEGFAVALGHDGVLWLSLCSVVPRTLPVWGGGILWFLWGAFAPFRGVVSASLRRIEGCL